MWRLRLWLRTTRSSPSVNTNILKRKKCKDICLKVIKVHQKKEKYQEFQCDNCEYKCSKRDSLRIYWHRNHKKESDVKTEEMWPMRVCMYKKRVLWESTLIEIEKSCRKQNWNATHVITHAQRKILLECIEVWSIKPIWVIVTNVISLALRTRCL